MGLTLAIERLAARRLQGSERAPVMKAPSFLPSIRVSVFLCVCLSFGANLCSAQTSPSPAANRPPQATDSFITIPGPLRSFLRMAGISQKATPEEVMPLLARNVFLLGYEGPSAHVRPT